MRKEFAALGFNTGNSVTPVIPIIIGDFDRTMTVWKLLFDGGIFVNPVIPPAVPSGRCLLRTSYMATHSDEQLDKVLETFARIGKQVGII